MKKILVGFLLLFITLSAYASSGEEMEFAIIINSDVTIYEEPSTGAPKVNFSENIMGKSFSYLGRDGRFIHIEDAEGNQGYLLEAPENILTSNSGFNYIRAQRTDTSSGGKLYIKALVLNKVDSLKGYDGKKDISEIMVYSNPNLTGEPIGEISIFEIRYIFSQFVKDGKIRSYLLGRSVQAKKDDSSNILIGWINAENIIQWNNKIGVEFNKRNMSKRLSKGNLGKIYNSERDLKGDRTAFVSESEDNKNYMEYYANRFPVLEKTYNENYKLAYIGNAIGTQGKKYTKRDIESQIDEIMQIINNKKIQMAILVDATSGMSNHIGSVKDALKKFFSSFNEQGTEAEISVAAYRDYSDGDAIYQTNGQFCSNISKINSYIDSIQVTSSAGDRGKGAYPEAVFYGINKTIDSLPWRGKGEKFILLLGDHGNHESYDQYPQDKQFNARVIGDKLESNHMTLFAVQVNLSKEKKVFNDMFERQIENVIQNNMNLGKLVKVSGNSSSKIKNAIADIFSTHFNITKVLTDIRNNAYSESGYKGVFSQKILERYGINPAVFKAVQMCDIGYAKPFDPNENSYFSEYALIEKRDIESLKVQMQQLSDAVKYFDPESAEEFAQTVYKVVKQLTGDKISRDENIAEFIKKKSGLPITTQFLNQSIDDLIDAARDEGNRSDFRKEVELKIFKLESVVFEVEVGNPIWDADTESYYTEIAKRDRKRKDYLFSLEQPIAERKNRKNMRSTRHAWVPIEFLP